MKITVLGGGGVRSMFLAKSIAQKAKRLGIDELCFMDNDEEKLRIYGGMAAHVARLLCPEMRFSLTADPVEAAQDADYVITTIRVGQDEMRAKDERIALDHGVLGQETTGAAGLSFAMRSVPALAAYCELIKKYAKPSVKVFNFTNPAGVVVGATQIIAIQSLRHIFIPQSAIAEKTRLIKDFDFLQFFVQKVFFLQIYIPFLEKIRQFSKSDTVHIVGFDRLAIIEYHHIAD